MRLDFGFATADAASFWSENGGLLERDAGFELFQAPEFVSTGKGSTIVAFSGQGSGWFLVLKQIV
jgi:hypothetical protein